MTPKYRPGRYQLFENEDFESVLIRILNRAATAWTFSNVIAGSDSVGSLMRTIMFNLLVYPHTLAKLYDELRSANLSRPFPQYSEVRNLPYLDACVQEGIRMHPPFALPFERVVPEGGITILGQYLPAATIVGGSPYVVNRHKGMFGEDAEFWRPERWLEKDEMHKKKLEQAMLTVSFLHLPGLFEHTGSLTNFVFPSSVRVGVSVWEDT